MDKFRSRRSSFAAYEGQQEQLVAAHEAKQEQIAERKAALLEKYGDHFAERAGGDIGRLAYDERTLGYAVDSMAQQYAERGVTDLSKVGSHDRAQIEDKAVGEAFTKDQGNRDADQKKWALGYDQAAQEVGEPNKAAEGQRMPPVPGPEYGAEKVESREPSLSYKDLDREQGETVARLEGGEELRSDYGSLEPEELREQSPARTLGGIKAEQALATDRGEERGKLEFFEDLEKGEDRDIGAAGHGKSDDRQGKLEFYEDRNPSGREGPDLDL